MDIWPGKAYPLGSTYDGAGVNFALFSEVADRVELCLIDDDNTETRLELTEVDGYVWHGYVPNLQPGQRYFYALIASTLPHASCVSTPGASARSMLPLRYSRSQSPPRLVAPVGSSEAATSAPVRAARASTRPSPTGVEATSQP